MDPLYRPRIGISACLLGEPVRWDAGHKRDAYLVDVLGKCVEWVAVCPEVEAGFGTPRETMQLARAGDGRLRLLTTSSDRDVTTRLVQFARKRVEQLADERLSGYVLKKNSPSCGMVRVPVYGSPGSMPKRNGRGLFAEALLTRLLNLPVEEEGRLTDARLRENFIERVFAYARVQTLFGSSWTLGDLVAFHAAHKPALMVHSPAACRALEQLVATGRARSRQALAVDYETGFMQALTTPATAKRHANVPRHMLGLRHHV